MRILHWTSAFLLTMTAAGHTENTKTGNTILPCTAAPYKKIERLEAADLKAAEAFVERVRAQMLSQVLPPPAALHSGEVCVAVTVDPSGKVVSKIISKSGGPVVDAAVLHMLRRIGPFPALPAGFGKLPVTLNFPLTFRRRSR